MGSETNGPGQYLGAGIICARAGLSYPHPPNSQLLQLLMPSLPDARLPWEGTEVARLLRPQRPVPRGRPCLGHWDPRLQRPLCPDRSRGRIEHSMGQLPPLLQNPAGCPSLPGSQR